MVNLFGLELNNEDKEYLLEQLELHAVPEDYFSYIISLINRCSSKLSYLGKPVNTPVGTLNFTADLYNKLVSKKCFGTVITLLITSDIILSSEKLPNSSAYKFFQPVFSENNETTFHTVSIILNSNSVDVSFPEVITKTQFESFLRCEKIVYVHEEITIKKH